MKPFVLEFCKRGLFSAAGGPVVLAIVYGINGATGLVTSLTPGEVCMGILTVTLMAFIAAGTSAVYHVERLPLASAIAIHAGVLYLDYLMMYLLNSWIPKNLRGIGGFTAIFALVYALIWVGIYASNRIRIHRINQKLRQKKRL